MCLRAHNLFLIGALQQSRFFSRRSQKMKKQFIKLRVSSLEKKIIQRKSASAGLTISEYLRRLAFEKEVKARLTEDEITCYQNLSKYADNFRRISNLFKQGDVTKMKEEMLLTSKLIREHLSKFQK